MALLLENGDRLLLESGDALLDETSAADTALSAALSGSAALAAELFVPQALRISGPEDSLQLATRTAASNAFLLGLVKLASDRNYYSTVFSFENGAEFIELVTDATGTQLCVFDHVSGQVASLVPLTVGTWHKVGLWVGAGTWKAWVGTVGTPGVTEYSGTCATLSGLAYQGLGGTTGDPINEWLDGALSRVRAGNGAITEAQVEAEFTSETPLHAGIIGAWFPGTMTAAAPLAAQVGAALIDGAGAGTPAYTLETAPALDPAAIALDAALAASAALAAELTTGAASLAASLTGATTMAAQLTTAIVLTSAPSSSATLAAALTTAIRPTASLPGSASVGAQLTTSIALAAGLSGTATASASLTTAIRPTTSLTGSAALAAALTTAIRPSASLTGTATLAASLSAGALQLDAALSGSASLSASLTTAIALQAGLVGSASSTAALTTAIRLEAALAGAAGLGAELSTAIALAASLGATAGLAGELALVLLVPHYARPGELVTVAVVSEPGRVEVVQGRASVTVVTSPATAQVATPAVGVTPS